MTYVKVVSVACLILIFTLADCGLILGAHNHLRVLKRVQLTHFALDSPEAKKLLRETVRTWTGKPEGCNELACRCSARQSMGP